MLCYGWWISPTGRLYEVERHGEFMLQNPKLFGGYPPDDGKCVYNFAMRQGWIRVVNSSNRTLEIEIPSPRDKHLRLAKEIIPYGNYDSVYLSWRSEYLEDIPYSCFLESYSFRDLDCSMILSLVAKRMFPWGISQVRSSVKV